MRVAHLDRSTLRASLRPFKFGAAGATFDASERAQVVPRLPGAIIAVVNKVPWRAATLEQLLQLALSSTAQDCGR